MPLSDFRQKLDLIDRQLVDLFHQRMAVAADIARLKRREGLPVHDPVREREKLDAVAAMSPDALKEDTRKLFQALFELSRSYQRRVQKGAQERMGYGLIGEKLIHSFSPEIHGMLGDYDYQLYPLSAEELPGFMRENKLKGFNVTIPYKQAVIPYLDGLSDAAGKIGAVNTVIRREDGSLYGDNTDYAGFAQLLGEGDWRGRKALILGSGGSSKTVRAVLEDRGCRAVIISRKGPEDYGGIARHFDADLVVNTTPVGMYPDVEHAPLSLRGFQKLRLVIDLIYNPARTALMLEAEQLGIPARGGMLMLAAQAHKAAQLWGLCGEDAGLPQQIADRLSKRTLNIALIGMPGCGKTVVGQKLAEITGRKFFDIDWMIEEKAGRSIPDIFADEGEEAFRRIETECLGKAAKGSGAVIATGGGVVTRARNLPLLRQNSRVVWLERPLNQLPVMGRPLSQSRSLEALYQERAPLYQAWSELSVQNIVIEEAALQIKQAMLDD